jgi:serine protease
MKRLLALLLPLALAACQDESQPLSPDTSRQASSAARASDLVPLPFGARIEQVVPGNVIVKLRAPADPATFARGKGLTLARMGYGNSFALLRVRPGTERAEAARLAADPQVEYAEPDYLRQPTCDARYWAFHNPGGCRLTFQNDPNGRDGQQVTSYLSTDDADEDASGGDVPASFGAGGQPVFIASIDTGVDNTHPEFSGTDIIMGRDWISGGTPTDPNGHGTHTTGTMVGRTVGVAGVTGAGSNVKVFVQRVCGPNGCPTSAIVNAIREAADFNVKYPDRPPMVAMNLSLGGSTISRAERDAIHHAVNVRQVLVIASAGNDGNSRISCPACDANAISVAATNWQDKRSYYSNYGSGLDLSAPGGEMYSNTTSESGIFSAVPGGGYAYYQGTSMAAPQVTGTAAVVASRLGLKGAALRAQLESTADDLGAGGYDTTFGNGRLNAHRAVTAAPASGGGGGGGGTTCRNKKC